MATKPRRRQAGEGGISEYATKAGPRFLIKYPVMLQDGTKRVVLKRGFKSRHDAAAQLRLEIGKAETGAWVEPTKQRLDDYLAQWIAGQRLSASTLSSYRKNIRLHINPYLGETSLTRLTGAAVDAWMRTLEASGRADDRGGLSARTVRYIYTILRSALSDAVKHGRLTLNPTDRSTPPSPSEARPPEMQAWTAPELSRFLHWAEARDPDLAMGWRLLAATGMRRGEALALRWRDVDLEAGRLQVRRSQHGEDEGRWRATRRGADEDRPGAGRRHRRRHDRRSARLPSGTWLGYVATALPLLADPKCCTPLTREPITAEAAAQLARTLKAIADPARLRLLSIVGAHEGGEACVCDLTEPLGLTQPTVSHHLKVLVHAGLLHRDKRGIWAYYSVVPEALRTIAQLLEPT